MGRFSEYCYEPPLTKYEADNLTEKVTSISLLADDHPAVLEQVAEILKCAYDVVGEVRDGESLLELAEQLDPDVLVIDISMPM